MPRPGHRGDILTRVESRHRLGAASASRTAALVADLTDRELAVLRYLPSAMSQREISSEL
jgi:LuxR family transcriptional regulator, maltose regulon positive regulatory protein